MGNMTLIMRGGGVKGLAFVGALKILQREYQFTDFVGTSAGAITAVFLAAGYDCNELKDLLEQFDFARFKDASWVRALWNLFLRGYLYPGDELRQWVEENLQIKLKRDEVLLKDLKHVICFGVEPRFGTVLFDSKGERAHSEAAFAVRISASIPFLFKPMELNGRRTYDGGMVKNFPIHAALKLVPPGDFIALHLGPIKMECAARRWLPLELLQIWLNQDESKLLEEFKDRIVRIDPTPISTMSFTLSKEEKDFLVAEGSAAAAQFLLARGSPNMTESEATRLKEEAKHLCNGIKATRHKVRIRISALTLGVAVLLLVFTVFALGHKQHSILSFGRWFRTSERIMVAIPSTWRSNQYYQSKFCGGGKDQLQNRGTPLCDLKLEEQSPLHSSGLILPGVESLLDSVFIENPGSVVRLALSWRGNDTNHLDSLAGHDVVILGGPIRNAYFYEAEQKLVSGFPKGVERLPFDFSENVYASIQSLRYSDDPKNGIVVEFDDAGNPLQQPVHVYRSSAEKASDLVQDQRVQTPREVFYEEDYGIFLIGPNPFDKSRRLIAVSGTHALGSAGGLQYILDLTTEKVDDLTKRAKRIQVNPGIPGQGYLSGVLRVKQNKDNKLDISLVETVVF